MNYTFGSLLVSFTLSLSLAPTAVLAQTSAPDKKLVQYVRDARNSGEKQTQAEERAIKAGWPPAAVSNAAAYVYGTSSLTADSSAKSDAKAPAKSMALAPEPTPANVPKDSSKAAAKLPVPGDVDAKSKSPSPYEFRIGPGDTLQISVWKEPEASAVVQVRPDGIISTPLIKELRIAGLTPAEAEKVITEKLIHVIQEPDVTVVVTGINSKKIYTVGGVKKEGALPYTYAMTVMQAISEAGGLSEYAKRKKIYVLRTENGKQTKFAFNYDEVLKGNHPELNIIMLPGDTLVVPIEIVRAPDYLKTIPEPRSQGICTQHSSALPKNRLR